MAMAKSNSTQSKLPEAATDKAVAGRGMSAQSRQKKVAGIPGGATEPSLSPVRERELRAFIGQMSEPVTTSNGVVLTPEDLVYLILDSISTHIKYGWYSSRESGPVEALVDEAWQHITSTTKEALGNSLKRIANVKSISREPRQATELDSSIASKSRKTEKEAKNALPPKSKKAATLRKAVESDVTDVSPKREISVLGPDPDPARTARQKAITDAFNKERDDKVIAQLKAEGKQIFDAAETSKKFGLIPNASWDQRRLQFINEMYPHVLAFLKLKRRAEKIDKTYIVPGRNAIKRLIADAYEYFLAASSSPLNGHIFKELRGLLHDSGVTVHKDAPDASVVIRTIFNEFDHKQVHLYSRSLEHARAQGVAAKGFVGFVDQEGGFEKIRVKAAKANAATKVQDDAESAQQAKIALAERLEFQRTEPFLSIKLTPAQFHRMKPNATVSTPGKNFDMVVMLAQMDTLDMEVCNVYATVPMTTDLRNSIELAFSRFVVFDADYALRFDAWKEKRKVVTSAKARRSRPKTSD